MKNSITLYSLLIVLFSFVNNNTITNAQDNSLKIDSTSFHLASKSYEDSIVIRWIPKTSAIWQEAQFTGYKLERIMIIDSVQGVKKTLIENYKPMSHDDIIKKYGNKNKYVSIMDQTLYGEQFKYGKRPPINLLDSAIQGSKQLDTRYFLSMLTVSLSNEAGNVGALRYVDKDVIPGVTYIYILSARTDRNKKELDTVSTFAINVHFSETPPENLLGIGYDKRVELHWSKYQLNNFDAYDIERSDDGGKTYTKINKIPFVSPKSIENLSAKTTDSTSQKVNDLFSLFNIYIDSIPENYKDYYYRIRGYDGFGSVGKYSEPIITHGIDLTPPSPPRIDSVVNISSTSFRIYWNPNTTDSDLKGYFIMRSTENDGEYVSASDVIIDKNSTEFTDEHPFLGINNFYIIGAVDTAGNISQSLPKAGIMIDSIPPSAPTGLVASIDSIGVVSLHWKRNPEPDIKGYKLYFSYSPNGVFTQVNKTAYADSIYKDTISLKIINREVYYKMKAIDYHSNHSAFSTIIKAKVPILFAPPTAVAKRIYLSNNSIVSEWYASSGDGVIGYEIYRRKPNSEWKTMDTISIPPFTDFKYIDTTFDYNTDYDYSVSAIDEGGYRSKLAVPVGISYNKYDLLDEITDFSVEYDQKRNCVLLKWNLDNDASHFFIIYKSENGSELTPIRSIDNQQHSYSDYAIEKGKTYHYAIQIKETESQRKSKINQTKGIKVE